MYSANNLYRVLHIIIQNMQLRNGLLKIYDEPLSYKSEYNSNYNLIWHVSLPKSDTS